MNTTSMHIVKHWINYDQFVFQKDLSASRLFFSSCAKYNLIKKARFFHSPTFSMSQGFWPRIGSRATRTMRKLPSRLHDGQINLIRDCKFKVEFYWKQEKRWTTQRHSEEAAGLSLSQPFSISISGSFSNWKFNLSARISFTKCVTFETLVVASSCAAWRVKRRRSGGVRSSTNEMWCYRVAKLMAYLGGSTPISNCQDYRWKIDERTDFNHPVGFNLLTEE